MKIIRSCSSMQRMARLWKKTGVYVGFVPTMGFLHEGHLSLVRAARKRTGPHPAQVVLSIYVNPTQFAPNEDLARYPRDLPRDLKLCKEAGVDVVFVPDDSGIYPRGLRPEDKFSTFVAENAMSSGMEGRSRPAHFRGVATIVAKLFNLVLPDLAVFGSKDYQQAVVIRRMVRDLNFPVQIVVAPTLRESDGLAMSSRNKYLSPAQRAQAVVLWQAIRRARAEVRQSAKPLAVSTLRRRLLALIEKQPEARVDYIEFFDSDTLAPHTIVGRGTHLAMAVFIGNTRLIDNARIETPAKNASLTP